MIHQKTLDALRITLSELAEAHVTAAICVSQLQDLLATDSSIAIGSNEIPFVDDSKFCIVWHGRTCYLGPTKSFWLFAHLLRRADHYVKHDQLLHVVWGCDVVRSPNTIRSAIRELRSKLNLAEMKPLALLIRGEGQHYGLILHHN